MIATLATLVVLAASSADSARWIMGRDVTDPALESLQAQPRVAVVRHTRARERDEAIERVFPVDTMSADASWLLRFERLVRELPQTRARPLRLVPGQTYPFLYRVGPPERPGPPDAWFDFRGPIVLLRADGDSTARLLRGRETEAVRLLRRLDAGEASLRQLAAAFGVLEPAEATPLAPMSAGSGRPTPERADSTAARGAAPASRDTLARATSELVPVPLTRVPPEYPERARRERIQGNVMVKVLVDEQGRPAEVRVVRSVPALDDAAVAAVARWTFRPATKDGKPVSSWVVVPVEFRLR